MSKNTNHKINKGTTIFICIAMALILILGVVVYIPKLFPSSGDVDPVVDISGSTVPPVSFVSPTAHSSQMPFDTQDPIDASGAGYAVSTSNPLATAVGISVLKNGGNAVDAAVAVAYTLGVVEPYASGIGGGGGMLVYDPETNSSSFFDYRDAAGRSTTGVYGKIGVPGFVLGMETVNSRFGSLELSDLIQYAIEYAENGFLVSSSFAGHLQSSSSKLNSRMMPCFYNNSTLLKEGDMLYQPELADTLRLIQQQGSSVFYNGIIAEHIMETSKLESLDFANYKVYESEPVSGTYNGYTVYSAPAPFSGTTLIQMLEIAEAVDVVSYDDDVLRYANIMASISTVTLNERRDILADPRYYMQPADLLSDSHIAGMIDYVKKWNAEYIETDPEHESTTHFSIIDSNGMVVSCTNTLSDFFGLGMYVDGFFLNDTLVTASGNPTSVNYTLRGQRPRTFALPTIVLGDDGLKIACGSSGGDRIPQVVFQILLRFFNGEDLQVACEKSRLIMDGRAYHMESRADIDPNGLLKAAGFSYRDFPNREYFGAFNAVGCYPDGRMFGAADSRRSGSILFNNPNG